MIRFALTSASALALLASPAQAQDFVITNAKVAIGDGSEPINDGVVIVEDGKIVYAGPRSGAGRFETDQVQDIGGKWVTPGLVAAVTDLGLADSAGVSQSNDKSASKARFNASLDVGPAINPASQHVAVARTGGLTRAIVAPSQGGSLFAGQGAVIDLGSDTDAIEKARVFQLANLGETGARLSGGSRTAAHVELRNALAEAIAYANNRWDGARALLPQMDAKALGPVVSGEQKLFVEVERAADILGVIALKHEFPKLDLALVGASEGWMVARDIAAAGVPVIANPMNDLPASFEQLAATQSNVGRMSQAGVKVAIGTLSGSTGNQPRNAAQYAGNMVGLQKVPGATGLSWGKALAAITSVPAEIAGMGGKFGVLKPGAAGDLVIWDGDPLEVSSAPVQVFIDGVEQPLQSHQTRLRDRYRDLDESDLPKAFDH